MTDNAHILIVDDDRRIRQLLASYLGNHGFRTTLAASAHEAREHLRGIAFDVLVLDVMMPGESGVSLASTLRAEANQTPILMLSALADAGDRIKGLAAGSDDYLTKPFEPEELLLRLRNLLRRAPVQPAAASEVRFGEFSFFVDSGELQRGSERLRLTGREREMLRTLAAQAGRPVPREQLASTGPGESARAVDVQINRLRQKIEANPADPAHLQTVRGEGYVLRCEQVMR